MLHSLSSPCITLVNTSPSTLTVAATSPPLRTPAGYSRRVQTSRPPLVIAELSTARLVLRPLDPTVDATDLFEMDADPLVHQYVYGSSPSHSVEQLQRRLAGDLDQNGGMTWAVRLRDEATMLGAIGIFADQGSTIRGLSWSLRRSHWGQGLMSEAASAIVPFLLAQPGVDGLEAWADRVGQTVVMGVAAEPVDPTVFTITTALEVHDVERTARLLCELFGMHVASMHGEPAAIGEVAIAPWSGSVGTQLRRREREARATTPSNWATGSPPRPVVKR